MDARLYPIQSNESYYFYTGKTPDQQQILMGLACPDLVAFYFNTAGEFLEARTRRLEFLNPSGVVVDGEPVEGHVRTFNIYDQRIPKRLRDWQQEIGFEPGAIRVKEFFFRDFGIGVQDYPEYFHDVLSDPESTDEERDDVRESMRLWDAESQFVLMWGNDYWLDGEGEVVSS